MLSVPEQPWRLALAAGALAVLAAVAPAIAQSGGALRLYSSEDARLGRLDLDPNGFLLNPRWLNTEVPPDINSACRFRVATGHLDRRSLFATTANCLSSDERMLVTIDEAVSTLGLGAVCATGNHTGVRGHVNWFPVTATGQLVWNSFSSGAGDGDVNIDFVTPSPNAVTAANGRFETFGGQRGYHLEFYNYETIARLPIEGRSFWHSLRRTLRDDERARRLVNDRFAIATGVYGVDGVHGFHAELHPVFAMSILEDVQRTTEGRSERWAVMVRNTGSEGDCSSGTIPLLTSSDTSTLQDMVIDLGEREGASLASISLDDSWSSHGTQYLPTYQTVSESGANRGHVYLRFKHPRPRPAGAEFVFLGTVIVTWRSEETTQWELPFASQLPRAPRPSVKLDPIDGDPPVNGTQSSDLQPNFSKLPRGLPGRDVYSRRAPAILTYVPPRNVSESGGALGSPIRVERTPAWPIADSVEVFCTPGTGRRDPLCLSGRRLAVGLGDLRPILGLFLFPHSIHLPGDDAIASAISYLGVLGYRFEARGDAFRTVEGSRGESGGEDSKLLRGGSLRLSPYLAPSIVWTSRNFSAVPYTMANIGVSWVEGREGQWTWGWGLGMHLQVLQHDLFVEGQNMVRYGGFRNEWVFSIGWLAGVLR